MIAREETHLSWLQTALERARALPLPSAAVDASGAAPVPKAGKKRDAAAYRDILDGRRAASRRRSSSDGAERVATRDPRAARTMLDVVLGESLEHQRLFEQAAAGSKTCSASAPTAPRASAPCCPTRWQE